MHEICSGMASTTVPTEVGRYTRSSCVKIAIFKPAPVDAKGAAASRQAGAAAILADGSMRNHWEIRFPLSDLTGRTHRLGLNSTPVGSQNRSAPKSLSIFLSALD